MNTTSPKLPPELLRELVHHRVVPFVGSGVSMAVRYQGTALFPSWGELLEAMAKRLEDDGKKAAANIVNGHIEEKEWFDAAAQALKKLGKAAVQQLKALLANWTLLFVGFGLQDEYVMQMVGDVFKTFGKATRPHYALMRKVEANVYAQKLWCEHNIQLIEYADHGTPLIQRLEQILQQSRQLPVDSQAKAATKLRPVVPPDYVKWLAEQLGQQVDLSGLRRKHGQTVPLRSIYVTAVTGQADARADKRDDSASMQILHESRRNLRKRAA